MSEFECSYEQVFTKNESVGTVNSSAKQKFLLQNTVAERSGQNGVQLKGKVKTLFLLVRCR